MILDLNVGGVLAPGLLAIACLALVAAAAVMRLLSAVGLSRRLAAPALAEVAVFIILYGLLLQVLPASGLRP